MNEDYFEYDGRYIRKDSIEMVSPVYSGYSEVTSSEGYDFYYRLSSNGGIITSPWFGSRVETEESREKFLKSAGIIN